MDAGGVRTSLGRGGDVCVGTSGCESASGVRGTTVRGVGAPTEDVLDAFPGPFVTVSSMIRGSSLMVIVSWRR